MKKHPSPVFPPREEARYRILKTSQLIKLKLQNFQGLDVTNINKKSYKTKIRTLSKVLYERG